MQRCTDVTEVRSGVDEAGVPEVCGEWSAGRCQCDAIRLAEEAEALPRASALESELGVVGMLLFKWLQLQLCHVGDYTTRKPRSLVAL